jgi:hypothetical protein
MKINLIKKILVSTFCLFISHSLFASQQYLLCGPDEDGCPDDGHQYCACIPFNEAASGQPFCMDFDARTCKPLKDSPNCDPNFIFKTQAECLAMIYQSDSVPACQMTTLSLCKADGSYICGEDGFPGSCKKA